MAKTVSGTLSFPSHQFSPEDLLHFVELDEFADDWKRLGLDVETDLWALQVAIMCDPKGPPVVPGTGGLRKIRFAPTAWNRGKRGAVRVCYVYFEEYWLVLLVVAYGKNEKDELTPEEKQGIKEYIRQTEKYLAERRAS